MRIKFGEGTYPGEVTFNLTEDKSVKVTIDGLRCRGAWLATDTELLFSAFYKQKHFIFIALIMDLINGYKPEFLNSPKLYVFSNCTSVKNIVVSLTDPRYISIHTDCKDLVGRDFYSNICSIPTDMELFAIQKDNLEVVILAMVLRDILTNNILITKEGEESNG